MASSSSSSSYFPPPSNYPTASSSSSAGKRKAPDPPIGENPYKTNFPATQEWEDDEHAHQVVDLTQQDDDASAEGLEEYGVLDIKIVGIRYYTGIVTVGEQVIFRREPQNRV